MVISLPQALEEAIATALKSMPGSQWLKIAQSLSEHYRDSLSQGKSPRAGGAATALGYAAIILPATYAQLYGALAATRQRVPGWQPQTLLDIGSGPGTALWAATEIWPELDSLTAWEREPGFINLGRQLAAASSHPAVRQARWRQLTLSLSSLPVEQPRYDLIVLGHMLNELHEELRRAVVTWAWEHCQGVLVMVEPGTSAAFPLVRALREHLLSLGATTLAPCVHDRPCPLEGDWCHFPQRLNRPDFQRRAKGGTAGWEESKFSYAAVARFGPFAPVWGRLLHQPGVHKAYAELSISSREGIVRPRIMKRNKAAFEQARSYRWGDLITDRAEILNEEVTQ